MQVFVDSQLERVYNFESFLELGSTNLVMFDEMPDRDIVVCNCKLGEFKTPMLECFCWWEEYNSRVRNREEAVLDVGSVMRLINVFVSMEDDKENKSKKKKVKEVSHEWTLVNKQKPIGLTSPKRVPNRSIFSFYKRLTDG